MSESRGDESSGRAARPPEELPIPVIPFHRSDLTDAEVGAVGGALRSGWLTSGPQVKAFEREFAEATFPQVASLPPFPTMTDEKVGAVIEAVRERIAR